MDPTGPAHISGVGPVRRPRGKPGQSCRMQMTFVVPTNSYYQLQGACLSETYSWHAEFESSPPTRLQSIAARQRQRSLTPKPDPGLLALASRQRRTFLRTRGDPGPGIDLSIQAAGTCSDGRSETSPIMDPQGNLAVHPTGGEHPPLTDDANQQRIHSPTTSRETDPVFLDPNSRSPSTSGGSEMPQNSQRSLAGETQASNNHSPAADGHDSIISPGTCPLFIRAPWLTLSFRGCAFFRCC